VCGPHLLPTSPEHAAAPQRTRRLPPQRAVASRHQPDLNYVQYGPSVDIDPGYLRDFFLLQIPLRGGAQVQCGAQHVDADTRTASLLSPTEPVRMRWADDSPHLIVKIALSALLSHLQSLAQAPMRQAPVFDLGVSR
jgi:hypothetical protein